MRISTSLSKSLYYFTGILLIILFWSALSYTQDSFVFPNFLEIFASLREVILEKDFLFCLGMSLFRVIITIGISLFTAFVLSFIYILNKEVFSLFKPLLVLFKSMPLAIISVYLWISVGADIAPYLITLLMILPVAIEGFIKAIDQIDISLINQLKTENVSFLKKYFKIYIPLIMPYIFMVILQTFGIGLKVMLMGEYICQTNHSLGGIIYLYKQDLDFSSLLALLILIMIIVSLIDLIIHKLFKKLVKI